LTGAVENSRLLSCLETDYWRIREVAPGHLDAAVPTCPGWTVADLTRHVAQVYLHKVEMMRHGKEPQEWPPTGFEEGDPLELLDETYAELRTEFANRKPSDAGTTWYGPDQTVGFWIRRMAQETVIHRIDAELGAGAPVAPVPDDLAIDGIDELLKVFVAYAVHEWPADFTVALGSSPGRTDKVQTDATADGPGIAWQVKTSPGRFTVQGGPGQTITEVTAPDLTVSGAPADILRWAWNRETPGTVSPLRVDGDIEGLVEFRACVVEATQ
jgi:uncharacterized protein (TIGR03083 family)